MMTHTGWSAPRVGGGRSSGRLLIYRGRVAHAPHMTPATSQEPLQQRDDTVKQHPCGTMCSRAHALHPTKDTQPRRQQENHAPHISGAVKVRLSGPARSSQCRKGLSFCVMVRSTLCGRGLVFVFGSSHRGGLGMHPANVLHEIMASCFWLVRLWLPFAFTFHLPPSTVTVHRVTASGREPSPPPFEEQAKAKTLVEKFQRAAQCTPRACPSRS